MKRLIAITLLALSFSFGAKAASTTLVLSNTVMTNLPMLLPGPAKIQSVILTASTTNVAQVQFVDTFTNWLKYTNSAYTNILSYATNYVTLYTNYYGATNTFTNIALVDVTNTVAGTTNLFNVPLVCSANTNQTSTVFPVNAVFVNGVWVTNTAGGTAVITVNYTQ